MALDTTVADTILSQLGGGPRVNAFIGIKQLRALTNEAGECNGLGIKFAANAKKGANYCTITLSPKDTYDVKFFKLQGLVSTELSSFEDTYCDQLVELFENATGLYLSFGGSRLRA